MTEETDTDILADEYEMTAAKIKHVLTVYPGISPTMLQAALGPQVPPQVWRPVLEDMKDNKIVLQSVINAKSPAGRYNDYIRLSLVETAA